MDKQHYYNAEQGHQQLELYKKINTQILINNKY